METIQDFIESDNGGGKRREYWWNYAIYGGKLVVDGPYSDEREATSFGYKNIPCVFETVCLSSRNTAKCTQIIKRKVWGEMHSLDFALKRASHKKPKEAKDLI